MEKDFVECRQNNKKANENTLHFRLNLLRILNASYFKDFCDIKTVHTMQNLEKKRQKSL